MENIIILALLVVAVMLGVLWRRAEKETKSKDDTLAQHGVEKARLQSDWNNKKTQCEQLETTIAELQKEIETVRRQAGNAKNDLAAATAKLETTQRQEQELAKARAQMTTDAAVISALRGDLNNERENAAEKIKLLQDAEKKMNDAFKNTAQQILDEKSSKFNEDSQKTLEPIKHDIKQFRERMDALHKNTTEERQDLKTYIKQVQENTAQISSDADNLTRALKGDNKVMGDWGENNLKRLLELSGLKKDVDYHEQRLYADADSGRQRPDFIINLPENKHLIIDSKVSLTAYSDYVIAADDKARQTALTRHLQSVNNHIKSLSEKSYETLHGINTPDFVFLFMPVEPAFHLAVQQDPNLFEKAFNKKIVLLCQSTLLPVLRTVAYMRQLEKQNENTQRISEQGGKLYDKICGFVDDLEKIGKSLHTAQKAYDNAHNKLKSGHGNAIGHAEKLRKMGVNTKKRLPSSMLTEEIDEAEEEAPALVTEQNGG